jgi:type I restriction enzyme R subunit
VQIYEPGDDDPITPPDDVPTTDDREEPIPPDEPDEDETIVDDPEAPDITIDPDDPDRPRKSMSGASRGASSPSASNTSTSTASWSPSPCATTPSAPCARTSPASTTSCARWSSAERKQAIIEELAEEGLLLEALAEEVGKDLDPFDLICHVAFDASPSPAASASPTPVRSATSSPNTASKARAVLDALLAEVPDEGVPNLDDARVLRINPFSAMGTPIELIRAFGGKPASSRPCTNCNPPCTTRDIA